MFSSAYRLIIRLLCRHVAHIAPEIVCYITLRFWSRTFRYPLPKREKQALVSAQRTQIPFKGRQIFVYQWGNGQKALLLGHGWNGRSSQFFKFIPALLSQGWKVIGFDAPGHGQSPGSHTSIKEMGELCAEIGAKFPEISVFIGHSAGGMAGLVARQRLGFTLDRIVCIATPISSEWLFDRFCDALPIHPPFCSRLKRRCLERQNMKEWSETSPLDLVRSVDTPALLVYEEVDKGIPLRQGMELAKVWKGSTLFVSKGLGHFRILRSDKVIEQVVRFIE